MKKIMRALYSSRPNGQRGATIVLVAVLMVVIIGITALAIDVSHLLVVKNELQNAADAGALAGARVLYNDAGTSVNSGANQEAYNAATANNALSTAGSIAVDVHWTSGNTGDVLRGHWSFGLGTLEKGFYPEDSLVAVDLSAKNTVELDEDRNFINAVKVVARRDDTPASSFFARMFGYEDFALAGEAVAYRGFAGTLYPLDVEQPIAICKQSIANEDGTLTCNTGRMSNSGSNADTHNTSAWTNFSQPCETANPPSVRPLVCAGGNPQIINLGTGIGSTGGELANVASDLRKCWMDEPGLLKDFWGYPREKWSLSLPVIDCPKNNPGTCSEVVGAVRVDVIWINGGGSDPQWEEVPMQMEGWECSLWVAAGRPTPPNRKNLLDATARQECWKEFAENFNLLTAGDNSVGDLTPSDLKSAIYFLPSCEPQEPRGTSGGENFGILAKIPVLVK
jgi:Flp pilus assembly protein TadG